MEVADENLLLQLECPVCKEYLYPPIKQCTTGHSMCNSCYRRVTGCPICRSAIGNIRNFVLETVISNLKFPCKNKASGCPVVRAAVLVRLHHRFCEYGKILCPLKESANCSWFGKRKDLVKHGKNHQPQVKNNSQSCLTECFKDSVDKKLYWLVESCNRIFKFAININFTSNIVQWSVQYVGSQEDATNYSYIITFIDMCKRKEKYSITSTCQHVVNDDKAVDFATSTTVEKLKLFQSSGKSLYFHLNIFLTSALNSSSSQNDKKIFKSEKKMQDFLSATTGSGSD